MITVIPTTDLHNFSPHPDNKIRFPLPEAKNFVGLKNLVVKNLIEMESFARAKNIVEVKGLVG